MEFIESRGYEDLLTTFENQFSAQSSKPEEENAPALPVKEDSCKSEAAPILIKTKKEPLSKSMFVAKRQKSKKFKSKEKHRSADLKLKIIKHNNILSNRLSLESTQSSERRTSALGRLGIDKLRKQFLILSFFKGILKPDLPTSSKKAKHASEEFKPKINLNLTEKLLDEVITVIAPIEDRLQIVVVNPIDPPDLYELHAIGVRQTFKVVYPLSKILEDAFKHVSLFGLFSLLN